MQSYEYVAYGLVYAARNAELYLTQPSGCSDMCNAVCDLAQENIAMSMWHGLMYVAKSTMLWVCDTA